MTTIATDGVSVAGDGLMTLGNGKVRANRNFRKVHRVRKTVFGYAGHPKACASFHKWMKDKKGDFYTGQDFAAVVLTKKGAFVVEGNGMFVPVEAPFAIGAGADFAMGAMAAGATAYAAIEIASAFNTETGGTITDLRLDGGTA